MSASDDFTARLMADVVWTPCNVSPVAGELVATHEGVLYIIGIRVRCYRLSDGRCVLDGDDVERLFGGERFEP